MGISSNFKCKNYLCKWDRRNHLFRNILLVLLKGLSNNLKKNNKKYQKSMNQIQKRFNSFKVLGTIYADNLKVKVKNNL